MTSTRIHPLLSRRTLLALLGTGPALAAVPARGAPLRELRLDWATYNPVSLVLRQQGLLEAEFARDGIARCAGCSRPGPTRRWSS